MPPHDVGVQYQSPTWDLQYKDTPWSEIGPADIDQGVEWIYGRIRMNRELWPYFENYPVARIRRHVTLLLSQLLGGPRAFDLSDIAQQMANKHAPIKHSRTGDPITVRAFYMTSRIFHAAFLTMPNARAEHIAAVMTTFWSLAPVIAQIYTNGEWVLASNLKAEPRNGSWEPYFG
jgi:truncated hemoglobin YjbI